MWLKSLTQIHVANLSTVLSLRQTAKKRCSIKSNALQGPMPNVTGQQQQERNRL